MDKLQLWQWRYTDEHGKRRTTRYHLTEENARARLKDPEKVENSLMEPPRLGHTSDFLKRS